MPSDVVKEKLIQYLNDALAMENAAVDRIQMRVNDTPIETARQQMQYHLEQTAQQKERLEKIISGLGGRPTNSKATLPKLVPSTMETAPKAVRDEPMAGSNGRKRMVVAEKELMQAKEDAIIENAEVVSYKMLMEMAEKAGMKEIIPALKQSMQEELAMANFIAGSAPMMLSMLWPELEESAKAKTATMAS